MMSRVQQSHVDAGLVIHLPEKRRGMQCVSVVFQLKQDVLKFTHAVTVRVVTGLDGLRCCRHSGREAVLFNFLCHAPGDTRFSESPKDGSQRKRGNWEANHRIAGPVGNMTGNLSQRPVSGFRVAAPQQRLSIGHNIVKLSELELASSLQ